MPIEFRPPGSDLLASRADILTCPVNCVAGVMGAGLARAFAVRWPDLPIRHRLAVARGDIRPGRIEVIEADESEDRPVVVLFPTKDHWGDPSRIGWVEPGLGQLVGWIKDGCRTIGRPDGDPSLRSIAVPALGCGLGRLGWTAVRPLIEAAAGTTPGMTWMVYPPGGGKAGGTDHVVVS